MNISYYIQPGKVNRKGRTSVMIDFAWKGYRLQMSSGVMVEPTNFVNTNKRLIHTREQNSAALEWKLGQLKVNLMAGYLKLDGDESFKNEITRTHLRELLDKLLGKSHLRNPQEQKTVKSTGTNIWIAHTKWQDLNRLKHSAGHLRKYLPVKKWLVQYAPNLTLEELTEEWVQQYANWLLENSTLRDGGMRSHFQFFRAMLKSAHMPFEWLANNFTESTSAIYLTYEEVTQIYQATYTTLALRETADMYVFLCMVGVRYSDYLKLNEVQEVETPVGNILTIVDHRQQKTKQLVSIPLNPVARAIWEKYNGKLPKPTNQSFNWRIKQVAFTAGLERIIHKTTVRNKVYTTTPHPVWELVSAHSARHTCATLLREITGNNILSQRILGQSSEAITKIYAHPNLVNEIMTTTEAWAQFPTMIPNV